MSILRRHSSRQGLQDLQRITVQRSLEDAEESERERRRRERANSVTVPPQDTYSPGQCEESLCKSNQKQSWLSSWEGNNGCSPCLEQVERQRQTEKCGKREVHFNSSAHQLQSHPSGSSHQHLNGYNTHINSAPLCQRPLPLSEQRDQHYQELEKADECREQEHEAREKEECSLLRQREGHEGEWEKMAVRQRDGNMCIRSGEWQRKDMNEIVREQRKEMKIFYTSKLRNQKDLRSDTTNGLEETFIKSSRLVKEEFLAGSEMNEGPQESERDETYEELFSQVEGHSAEGENEEEETAEGKLSRIREVEREKKRRSVMERMKRLSLSSTETDEPFSPLSPTLMDEDAERLTEECMCSISERTESLNRSVKKSNSFQKTSPPMIISKIDSRLEQYSYAIEASAQEVRDAKAGLMDLPSIPEPVSARKNMFEVGDAWHQNSVKVASSKDTEGLKVGVADLITQWVKGNPDVNSKTPSSKPTSNEVKAGEVREKKSLWETKDTSIAEKPGGKASMGKKFKFVETGFGKYEKVLVDDKDSIDHTKV